MDLDGDGTRDLLSGSYSRMESSMAGLFQVLRGQADGSFQAAAPVLGTDGEPLIIPANDDEEITRKICTRPYAIDWDGDQNLDLVVGNFAGSFYWFRGEGAGRFLPTPEPLVAGAEPLALAAAHSDPFPIDWDGDGDVDLLSGSANGGVYLAKNEAGPGAKPVLLPFVALIEPGPQRDYGSIYREEAITGPGGSTRVWAADVNEDGKLDLLVGDSVTLISPAEGVSEEEFVKRQAEWQEQFQKAVQTMTEATEEDARQKANEHYMELYQKRSEFMREERTGFVWYYQQR